jgi:electron transfer flavoprotein alpha subunit
MSQDIFALIEHRDGQISESSLEVLGKARSLAGATGGQATAVVLGQGIDAITAQLGGADRVIEIVGDSVANYTPPGYVNALTPVVRDQAPSLMLFPNSAVGMDVAAGVSCAMGAPMAAYATDVTMDGGSTVVTSQIYAGRIVAQSALAEGTGFVTMVAGASPAEAGKGDGSPAVDRVDAPAADDRVRFRRMVQPEASDVDITKEDILVAVGRGIGDGDDIEVVEELAEALGGAVACSRPVVDAGWLPKARQVGKSGQKVKPKLYIAVGISGAPEHLEGMRDAELIVAINSDPKAPIFGVAHYGTTEDLFDVVPALAEALG